MSLAITDLVGFCSSCRVASLRVGLVRFRRMSDDGSPRVDICWARQLKVSRLSRPEMYSQSLLTASIGPFSCCQCGESAISTNWI